MRAEGRVHLFELLDLRLYADNTEMAELCLSRVLYIGTHFQASLSLFPPFLPRHLESFSRTRHACHLALHILSNPAFRLHADNTEMAELCLSRVLYDNMIETQASSSRLL